MGDNQGPGRFSDAIGAIIERFEIQAHQIECSRWPERPTQHLIGNKVEMAADRAFFVNDRLSPASGRPGVGAEKRGTQRKERSQNPNAH